MLVFAFPPWMMAQAQAATLSRRRPYVIILNSSLVHTVAKGDSVIETVDKATLAIADVYYGSEEQV